MHPSIRLVGCLALTATFGVVGCSEQAEQAARERMTQLGETVQNGAASTRESLQRLGEATQERTEIARERLERAGDRVLSGKETLERMVSEPASDATSGVR